MSSRKKSHNAWQSAILTIHVLAHSSTSRPNDRWFFCLLTHCYFHLHLALKPNYHVQPLRIPQIRPILMRLKYFSKIIQNTVFTLKKKNILLQTYIARMIWIMIIVMILTIVRTRFLFYKVLKQI